MDCPVVLSSDEENMEIKKRTRETCQEDEIRQHQKQITKKKNDDDPEDCSADPAHSPSCLTSRCLSDDDGLSGMTVPMSEDGFPDPFVGRTLCKDLSDAKKALGHN